MDKKIAIAVGVAAVVIPLVIYTASPVFTNTVVNEPLPEFNKFMAMTEQERLEAAKTMSEEEKNMILAMAAKQDDQPVSEAMPVQATVGRIIDNTTTEVSGTFVGVNDGIHNANGIAKVILLSDGKVLRLEEFKATNGPDLYVYLATDKTASDHVSLGRLKGNVGNQNYEIPANVDLAKHDTVLIWCQAFSVLFGSAELR